jgi:hypothetical protein
MLGGVFIVVLLRFRLGETTRFEAHAISATEFEPKD